ncbi:MAG: PHB depolymerase family esterase [Acidobacteria bacterium]|jgi:poly(hydroxyalkanoate) depolymerase family esterase|nr:PHB depolymerase family esterase [Acidobacteriota bacterium]
MERYTAGKTCCVLAGLAAMLFVASASSSTLREIESFGSNPGHLQMFVHVPRDLPENAPLVVVPHGCFQSAQDVADNSGWVEMADLHDFALVFPQTSKANEPNGGCFRTWQPEHQKRGAGEPLSVRQMITWAVEHHQLDDNRVFIAGMSSGGLLTGVMLATYPDVFAAGAPQSAYPYRCANSYDELKPCAEGARHLPGEAWGDLVLNAYAEFSGVRPRVSIWHGETDPLIAPANLHLQLEQWATAAGVDQDADDVERVGGHVRKRYNNSDGKPVIETYMVQGMGHAIAVDPDGTPGCGVAAPFFVDAGICSAFWIARWFGIAR